MSDSIDGGTVLEKNFEHRRCLCGNVLEPVTIEETGEVVFAVCSECVEKRVQQILVIFLKALMNVKQEID